MRGKITKPKKLNMKLKRQSVWYEERSSALTPTKVLLIQAPTIGLNMPSAKFQLPVRKAKTVASMPCGVILANRAIEGRIFMAIAKHPNTTSVKTMRMRSLTPI